MLSFRFTRNTRLHKRKATLCAFICLSGLFLLYLGFYRHSCSDLSGQKTIRDLCELYVHGEIFGDICGVLCSPELKILECLGNNSPGQGKLVLLAHIPDYGKFVIKSQYSVLSMFERHLIAEQSETITNVLDYLKSNELFKPNALPNDFLTFRLNISKKALSNTAWALAEQDEYIFLKRYPNLTSKHLGFCGHVYGINFNPPLDYAMNGKFNYLSKLLFGHQTLTWEKRSMYALKLVRFVLKASKESVEICDMKEENFGISTDGRSVLLIDSDMAMSTKYLNNQLAGSIDCTGSNDKSCCDFVDCLGSRNFTSLQNKCLSKRADNNMMALCREILFKKGSGLLLQPPLHLRSDVHLLKTSCESINDLGSIENWAVSAKKILQT